MKIKFTIIIGLFLPIFTSLFAQDPAPDCVGKPGQIQWLIFENISGYDLEKLYHLPHYPQAPDRLETLESISTPQRYNDNYASLVRGFIRAPQTGDYLFNLTGDDNSKFLLSTDHNRENLIQVCGFDGWTGANEYDKYPEQTSDPIQLIEGNYYYFEAHQKERGGGDFVQVQWIKPDELGAPENTWSVIGESYLYSDACQNICPTDGTPCDDGNPKTILDQEDGHCNCSGIPTDAIVDDCIGQRGKIQALYYHAPNGGLEDIHTCEDYPMNPIRAEFLDNLEGPYTNADNYFTRVRGYLYIPVTGEYQFALTGNNQVSFMMSIDHTQNQVNTMAFIESYSEEFEFNKETNQISDPLFLEGGTFHYIELLHRETWGGDFFNVSWKTPFTNQDFWQTVNSAYLFTYNCEEACIPAGTACDDRNPNTFNDQYDANCQCVGTPCVDADCSNAMLYEPYEGCEDQKKVGISTSEEDNWVSCEPSISPNSGRRIGHWIMYDFGKVVDLEEVRFWNRTSGTAHQKANESFSHAIIDYSLDKSNWQLAAIKHPKTTRNLDDFNNYQGEVFPELVGIRTRYLLFTFYHRIGLKRCHGFSKINFTVTDCSAGNCDQSIVQSQPPKNILPANHTKSFLGTTSLNLSPNPTRDWTNIQFELEQSTSVKLGVFNAAGQLVTWIVEDAPFGAGTHEKNFPTQKLSAGVYMVNLFTSNETKTERLVVIN